MFLRLLELVVDFNFSLDIFELTIQNIMRN